MPNRLKKKVKSFGCILELTEAVFNVKSTMNLKLNQTINIFALYAKRRQLDQSEGGSIS